MLGSKTTKLGKELLQLAQEVGVVVHSFAGSTPFALSQGVVHSNVFERLIVFHVENNADDDEMTFGTIDG